MSALLRSAVPSRSVSQLGLRTSVTSLTRKWWLPPPSPSRSGLSCGSVWKSLSTTPSQCLPRDESSKGPTNHSTTPTSAAAKDSTSGPSQADKPPATSEKSEKLLNLPNILTASRILSVPFLGHLILTDRLPAALGLLFVAGCTDLLDGYLARKWQAYTVFGSIADPAADKLLMTVMVATLGWKGLLPGSLASLILIRDVGLVLLAFRIRYITLPAPFTWSRYWNPRLPSAQVQPTQISKYNTFLQLLSVGGALLVPALQHMGYNLAASYLYTPLHAVWWVTAATTLYSGWGYFVQGAGYQNVNSATVSVTQKIKEASQRAKETLRRGGGTGGGNGGPQS